MAALAVLAALHPRPLGAAQGAEQRAGPSEPIVVASKPFGESYVLAEVFAQLLEARGLEVDRRPGLGATEIAFQALRTGAIDLYPEYT
ncbi:MAG: ABC transporter, partial [Gemmatimonadetes bacterium]|nr:ABC transporter [Gemmatimonadota bacterium]